jgi:hypothetical protein
MTLEVLQQSWLALAVLFAAGAFIVAAAFQPARRKGWIAFGIILALVGLGGMDLLPDPVGFVLFVGAAAALAGLLLILAVTGYWSVWLG